MPLELKREQLIEIAEQYGTPVYVYHAERIKEQYQRLLSAFSNTNAKFFYAAKALTNINILRYIKSIGCNVDCSSINEALLAVKAGFEPQNIWALTSILTAYPILKSLVRNSATVIR
jgi:diaminopimelate decarboxylase